MLIEALLSVALLSLCVLLAGTIFFSGNTTSKHLFTRTQAENYAQEALEATEAMRDNLGFAFVASQTGAHGLTLSAAGIWGFVGTSNTTGGITRVVTVTSLSATRLEVSVDVSWSFGSQTTSLTRKRILSDFHRPTAFLPFLWCREAAS
jgi:hypothetical protein